MKKIIALIAMLSFIFLASCSKEDVNNTEILENEVITETSTETKSIITDEESEEVQAALDLVEQAIQEISIEADINTETQIVK